MNLSLVELHLWTTTMMGKNVGMPAVSKGATAIFVVVTGHAVAKGMPELAVSRIWVAQKTTAVCEVPCQWPEVGTTVYSTKAMTILDRIYRGVLQPMTPPNVRGPVFPKAKHVEVLFSMR